MSRSKHTDPKTIRAARRLRAPQAARGAGDLSRRRKLGRNRKKVEAIVHDERRPGNGWSRLRIVERRPRNGYHHPAGKQDVLKMLNALGPVAVYGLRSVELTCAPANAPASAPLFGRYQVPGRIVLFEQPMPPWRLPGVLKRRAVRRLERAGAVVTLLSDVGGTLVDWPHDTLRRFMLEEVITCCNTTKASAGSGSQGLATTRHSRRDLRTSNESP